MTKLTVSLTILLATIFSSIALVATPPVFSSTEEGENESDTEESNEEGSTEEEGGSTDDEDTEPEPEDTPPIQTDEPLAPLQPLLPETEIIPEEPEPINVCKSGLIFDTELGKCVPDALTELEELVGPPAECPPELGLTPLECLDEVVKQPVEEPPVIETEVEPEPEVEEPIDPCLLDPGHESCPEPIDGKCPEGYNMNEDEQCYPEHEQCPSGYHSHEDDESGKCIPDSTPCDDGYIMNPSFPECAQKDSVCEEHPNIDECKNGDDDDDVNVDVDVKVINKVINKVKNVNERGHENFPEIDIIGLSTKQNGDSMVCLINIDNEHVQCQEYEMPSDRVNDDFWRIIETDQDKDYDDGNTGSNDINGVIDDIKSQDFSELDDATNHDFDIDLAWIAINPQGDGVACLAEDSTGKGKSLCEPFKVSNEEIDGQITEGVAIKS